MASLFLLIGINNKSYCQPRSCSPSRVTITGQKITYEDKKDTLSFWMYFNDKNIDSKALVYKIANSDNVNEVGRAKEMIKNISTDENSNIEVSGDYWFRGTEGEKGIRVGLVDPKKIIFYGGNGRNDTIVFTNKYRLFK